MNGVHDMGGLQGMGPVQYEKNEPVFHAKWEGRIYALTRAMRAFRKWNLDTDRYALEVMPPLDYMRMSYFERWLVRLETHVVKFGLLTAGELKSGKAASNSARGKPALTMETSSRWMSRNIASSDDASVSPRFQVGDRVRARNMNPLGHTRLPRYARGKAGIIWRDHGVYILPDTNADFRGENRQHVYSIQFSAQELWGANASQRDSIYVDLWDDYLERA